jgi:hypothetical protein
MEEDCGGGQGLSWAVEPRRERMVWLLLNYIILIKFKFL